MTAKLIRRAIGVALLLVGLAPALASADEMSFRVVHYLVKYEVKAMGDVEGHFAGPWTRRGLAFFKGGPVDGEVATWVNVGTYDGIKGKGKGVAEATFTFEDGSTFKSKNVTIQEPRAGGTWTGTVTADIYGGTGRFAGIVGTAKGTGKQLTPSAGDTKGDAYFDVVVTYALPKPRT